MIAALALLGGCATIPQPLVGNYAAVDIAGAQQNNVSGNRVRWGGEIIKTEPGPQGTCIFMLGRHLDTEARPESGSNDATLGRFVACRAGFYDPEVFKQGREVTVTGTLQGNLSEKVGEYDYAYPRVEADIIYLWPEPVVHNYYNGFYDPFWGGYGPYGPYWGARYGGYWGRPIWW